MTSAAVSELDQFHMIFTGILDVAIQTPTHVHYLRVLGNGHFAHIAVTFFAVLSSRNMRTVVKLDKVRHDRNRHPFNGCAA